MSSNRRRSTLTERDVETKVIGWVFMTAIVFACISLFLTTLADHACGPAAHAVPACDVVRSGPSYACHAPNPQYLVDSKRASGALSANLAYR